MLAASGNGDDGGTGGVMRGCGGLAAAGAERAGPGGIVAAAKETDARRGWRVGRRHVQAVARLGLGWALFLASRAAARRLRRRRGGGPSGRRQGT